MEKIIAVMPKRAILFRLILAVLLPGAGLNTNADFDEGDAAYKKRDYATALREWQPLAEQGHAEAQYMLGVMYDKGEGVPKDYIYAHMWLNIAASGGNKDTVEQRNFIEKQVTPSQITEAQKLARECVRKAYKGC